MKNLAIALMIVFGFSTLQSCQQANGNQGADAPVTVEGQKALLKQKKQELSALSKSIKELEAKVAELDPSSVVEKERLVSTQAVKRQDFKTFVEIQGAVETDETVAASSETGGRLLKMYAKEGKWINKGDLVAETDGESINKGIAEIQTSLALARDVYTRQKNLWDQNIGSEIQYLQAKNQVEQLEKKIESTSYNLTKTKVFAPMSGIVDMVIVEQGEIAGPGAPIINIMKTSVVNVKADVSENYLKAVKRGAKVKIDFPSLEISRTARISELGRTINPANRTLPVEVRLTNPKGTLKPNLLAIMMLNDYSKKDAVVLPTELIQQDVSGKEFVFIQGLDDKKRTVARKTFVESGKAYDGLSVIETGLEGGEQVIVDGARSVTDGELLKVIAGEKPKESSTPK